MKRTYKLGAKIFSSLILQKHNCNPTGVFLERILHKNQKWLPKIGLKNKKTTRIRENKQI